MPDTATELYDIADNLSAPDIQPIMQLIAKQSAMRLRQLARHVREIERVADEMADMARLAEQAAASDNIVQFPRA